MIVTTFMFSAMDGVSRFLAERNNVFTLVTMRYWFIAIIMIILCLFIKNSFKISIGWNLGKKNMSNHLLEPFTSTPTNGTKNNAVREIKKRKIEYLYNIQIINIEIHHR